MSCAPAAGRFGVVCGLCNPLQLRQRQARCGAPLAGTRRSWRQCSQSPLRRAVHCVLAASRPPCSLSHNPLFCCRPGGLHLKGFMPARLRLATRGRTALLLPRSPASAPALVVCGHAKPKPGSGRCATERRAGACGGSPPRTWQAVRCRTAKGRCASPPAVMKNRKSGNGSGLRRCYDVGAVAL